MTSVLLRGSCLLWAVILCVLFLVLEMWLQRIARGPVGLRNVVSSILYVLFQLFLLALVFVVLVGKVTSGYYL